MEMIKNICLSGATAAGPKKNQDRFLMGDCITEPDTCDMDCRMEYPKDASFLAAVADGISSGDKGEDAAQKTVEFLKEQRNLFCSDTQRREIEGQLEHLNHEVISYYDRVFYGGYGGTTLSALAFLGDCRCRIINLGDSPILRFRNGRLEYLHREHSVAERKRIRGDMSVTSRDKRTLTAFIGQPGLRMADEANITVTRVLGGDIYLICSDGLTNTLHEEEIAAYLGQTERPEAKELVDRALAHREPVPRDNITAILVKFPASEQGSYSSPEDGTETAEEKQEFKMRDKSIRGVLDSILRRLRPGGGK